MPQRCQVALAECKLGPDLVAFTSFPICFATSKNARLEVYFKKTKLKIHRGRPRKFKRSGLHSPQYSHPHHSYSTGFFIYSILRTESLKLTFKAQKKGFVRGEIICQLVHIWLLYRHSTTLLTNVSTISTVLFQILVDMQSCSLSLWYWGEKNIVQSLWWCSGSDSDKHYGRTTPNVPLHSHVVTCDLSHGWL